MPFCCAQLAVQCVIGKLPRTAGCKNRQAGWRAEPKNRHKFRQSLKAVLILLYCCVTLPSRYAVRLTANPHATEKAEKLH